MFAVLFVSMSPLSFALESLSALRARQLIAQSNATGKFCLTIGTRIVIDFESFPFEISQAITARRPFVFVLYLTAQP